MPAESRMLVPGPNTAATPASAAVSASPDQDLHYKNGKLLVERGSYALAMQELEPLTRPAAKFARAPEAAYLYAVAASRARIVSSHLLPPLSSCRR